MESIPRKPCIGCYFSLVALTPAAQKVVHSPRNKHLLSYVNKDVSRNTSGGQSSRSYGLNIGRNIPQNEHDLLATIGRTGDIVVEKDYIPRLQCSFRMNTDTGAVLFYDHGDTRMIENNLTDPRNVNNFEKTKHGQRVLITGNHRTVFGFGAQNGKEFQFEIVWHKDPQKPLSDDERRRVRDPATLSIPLQLDETHEVEVFEKGWGPKLKLLCFGKPLSERENEVEVSRAVDISNGKVVAVKTMGLLRNPGRVRHTIEREVGALSDLKHPNVIQILSAHWNNDSFQIITPCYEGDAGRLKSKGVEFHERRNFYPIQGLFRNVLSALDYVHSKGLMHRDVKPENILYTSKLGDGNAMMYEFKLADFGASNQIRRGNTMCGTPGYIAPEISSKNEQSSKVDIWSLFATLLKLLDIKLGSGVIDNTREDWNTKAIRSRKEYKKLHFIADMYDLRPEERPSAAELKRRLRSSKHSHEPLASTSIPGFPASSRAFSNSSAQLPGTPGGKIHPAHRPGAPPSIHTDTGDARNPPRLRPARPVLGLDRQSDSPSDYGDSMSVKLGYDPGPPTSYKMDQKRVNPDTYIATSSPARRDELKQVMGRSQSLKNKLNPFKDKPRS